MAVKYRIEYCNKESDTARLDIDVRDYSGQIYPIEGTGDLFILEYKRSDDYILSTIADIQIFSDANFNIVGLKTSDETELKAYFYVNNVLKWQGYILPDFFQTGITGTDAISMTATDRLSVLKDVPLDYSLDKLSYIQLITECLAKTGLSLNCNVVADFMLDGMPSTFHIMNCYVDHSRITNRNKSLSAYDVLRSVLVMLNAQIVQWAGEWWIVNRYQLRNGGGRVYNYTTSGTFNTSGTFTPTSIPFGMVEANGRRSIEPVASQTSVFMEFGGVRRYPDDYEFRNYNNGYAGWTEGNGFTCSVSSKELLSYTAQYVAIEGTRDVRPRMWQANAAPTFYDKAVDLTGAPYLKSTPLVNKIEGKINVDVNVSATGVNGGGLPFIILIDNKRTDNAKERYYVYGKNGIEKLPATNITADINKTGVQEILFYDENLPATAAISASTKLNFTINSVDVGVASFIGTEFSIVIYGTSFSGTVKTYIEEASIGISNVGNGKGVLYRTDQGAGGYSKKSDSDTTIFGDHLSQGINGFFYAYSHDELSIHSYLGQNIRTGWISPDDAQVDPILLHSVRQRARTNSVAKSILNVNIAETFNPLAIYTCNATSYVVRSARHDFLRTRTSVELEENASQNLLKKDYIYTYFGDEKEKGISSLAGISGGGSTGGGASHMHSNKDIIDQLSQLNLDVLALLEVDDNDNLKVSANLYSTGEVSAYGYGASGGSGSGGGSTVVWGTESAGAVPLTVESVTKTLSLASHAHSGYITEETDPNVPDHVKAITDLNISTWNAKEPAIVKGTTAQYFRGDMSLAAFPTSLPASDVSAWAKAETKPSYVASEIGGLGDNYRWLTDAYITTWNAKEPAITKLTAFNKNFGTAAGTVAEGNDSRINNGQTAFGWGNHASAGYALNSALTAHINKVDNPHAVTKAQVGLGNVDNTSDANKPISTAVQTALNLKANLASPTFTGSVTAPTFIGALTGNASSATKLQTARTIWGRSFNGTANVSGALSGATTGVFSSTVQATTAILTNLTANYLPKHTATGLVNSSIFDNGTNVGIRTTTPTATLDVNGTGKFKDDILTPFYTWANATDKNSLKAFLNLFDLDTAGNLVVKTNLYSTGEVTAYKSGTGVSGLTLQGDMNANGKNINNVGVISAGGIGRQVILQEDTLNYQGSGIFCTWDDGPPIASFDYNTEIFYYGGGNVNYNTGLLELYAPTMKSSEFKFGSWSFKEVSGNMVIYYNGTAKATIQSSRPNSNL